MTRLADWLLRGHCLIHAEPLFDRDEGGRAVFRCPRCLATWPILSDLAPPKVSEARSRTQAAAGTSSPRRLRLARSA